MGDSLFVTWNPLRQGSDVSYRVSILEIIPVVETRIVTTKQLSPQFINEVKETNISSPILSKY